MKQAKGFTLLEVMIAITVFALVASTLSQSSAITVDNQIHLEKKVLASWIAENKISELRFTPYQDITNERSEIEFADRKWQIKTTVTPKKQFQGIPLPLDVKQVTVSVSSKQNPDNSIHTLIAYMANDDA
ncbi:type II secretion system minor pseudopilin GspI [Bermanella marisrubri]|uniref:Type II secretion system protein I n=1 Tax=Bermanella marisrubri TaxID=207949 RepID=Q1N4H3_9GAMM|nr:type II secretion system minor pseudopilin GspI [Bermanella marisrubri]EAT13455.1 general secretion pathway protein I [Oceanobacter sp. RED65] [Bermanella marisrubri]QIZ84201.1 type II secretion system minor pseudopilin GspI [Bermanella marisrubri]